MSAIHQTPESVERRAAERLAVVEPVSVVFGRGNGILVDLSLTGARIRHGSPVQRGSTTRISFEWERRRFAATARVLAVRVSSLGAAVAYESRVHFTALDPASEQVLAAALDSLTGRNVRRWVANLHGWSEESQPPSVQQQPAGSFIRCRLHGAGWWERKCTTATEQPENGFLLPADTKESEIATLCDTYERASDEERGVIRMLAAAVVEQIAAVH